MRTIEFVLNGEVVRVDVDEGELLLSTLRERLGIKSVKEGCSIGECGVCTVLVDDLPRYSCLTVASKVQGRDVKTVEFLGTEGCLHRLQQAFIKSGAVQCGYCTPGMLLSAYSLLLRTENPDDQAIREAISGNLCRCTGYIQIIEAVRKAAGELKSSGFGVRSSGAKREGASEERSLGASEHRRGGASEERGPDKGLAQEVIPTKAEVLELLAGDPSVKIIAGGTDLLVQGRRKGTPGTTVDVSRLADMEVITEEDGVIRIGAAATHGRIAADPLIRRYAGSLVYASGQVGSPQIRNMGTIGGNLTNASPAADSLPPLLIHNAVLTLESIRGVREVPVEDFVTGPYRTSIQPGELVTSIRIDPLLDYREGYRRVARRAAHAISRLSLAWAVKERDGFFEDLRCAVGSCTPVPFRASRAEAFLRQKVRSDETVAEAAEMVIQEIIRASGMRPSYAYKLPVLRDLIVEVLGR